MLSLLPFFSFLATMEAAGSPGTGPACLTLTRQHPAIAREDSELSLAGRETAAKGIVELKKLNASCYSVDGKVVQTCQTVATLISLLLAS